MVYVMISPNYAVYACWHYRQAINSKRKSSGEKEKFFRRKVAEDNLKIKSCGTDILQIFQNLMPPEEENFTEEKPGPQGAEHFRDCRPGNGNDLFAKNQNGGLEKCWTLQKQV